jgi:hypothetical protein
MINSEKLYKRFYRTRSKIDFFGRCHSRLLQIRNCQIKDVKKTYYNTRPFSKCYKRCKIHDIRKTYFYNYRDEYKYKNKKNLPTVMENE